MVADDIKDEVQGVQGVQEGSGGFRRVQEVRG
jgi:hypothetical protein